VQLLRQHRASRDFGSGLAPENPPSLLQSPLVIAMPRPMAEALGWPQREIGWADVLQLARDRAGWGSRGHPEWGEFRLGKTNPNISTSGLHALIGAYFAATQRSTDLTEADVADARVVDFVKGVESAVVHYGDTVSTFVRHLKAADDRGAALSYVSAIVPRRGLPRRARRSRRRDHHLARSSPGGTAARHPTAQPGRARAHPTVVERRAQARARPPGPRYVRLDERHEARPHEARIDRRARPVRGRRRGRPLELRESRDRARADRPGEPAARSAE